MNSHTLKTGMASMPITGISMLPCLNIILAQNVSKRPRLQTIAEFRRQKLTLQVFLVVSKCTLLVVGEFEEKVCYGYHKCTLTVH